VWKEEKGAGGKVFVMRILREKKTNSFDCYCYQRMFLTRKKKNILCDPILDKSLLSSNTAEAKALKS
jgi:hypothetical protein